jgi:hypothetical protein
VLELGVTAAIIEKGSARFSAHRFHLADDDGVIATFVHLVSTAFNYAQDVVKYRIASRRSSKSDSLEPVDVNDGEAARDLFLSCR